MKVIIDIPNKEAAFGMKVLKSLSFVKMAEPMSPGGINYGKI
jgi:hypothetical protein